MKKICFLFTLIICSVSVNAAPKLKALIVDGQNNHWVWAKSTLMMKQYLEESGRFTVDVQRTKFTWKGGKFEKQFPLNDGKTYQSLKEAKTDPDFLPNFSNYDVVISNFGWKAADWSEKTMKSFENYMKQGGGFVAVHAANNSFPNWVEYNKMIGLGGWGGRNHNSGPYVYYNDEGKLIRDTSKGSGGSHDKQAEFQLTTRAPEHPIMEGLPKVWMQTKDELYGKLRGPAENMTILATAYSTKKSKRHEPMLMTIDYHQGRVFHTTLGHADIAFSSVGFITTFLRGAEWAATGKVTIPVPDDFPTAEKSSKRKFSLKK